MDNELKQIYKILTSDLRGRCPIKEALNLYGAKDKVIVHIKQVPGNKKGLLIDSKNIYIDPSCSPGEAFVTLIHELEHWKNKDFLKRKETLRSNEIWAIEERRTQDAFHIARMWHEKNLKECDRNEK